MQGEDDLRGLSKIMGFMRAVSILWCSYTFTGIAMDYFLKEDGP